MSSIIGTVAERTLQGFISAINGDIEGTINGDTSLDGDLQRGNVKLLFENTAEKGQVLVVANVSESGKPGSFKAASVYTRVLDDHIQFSTDNETWRNVIPVADITGPEGADGKNAYEYATDGGYTGTEEEFAEKMALEIVENPSSGDTVKWDGLGDNRPNVLGRYLVDKAAPTKDELIGATLVFLKNGVASEVVIEESHIVDIGTALSVNVSNTKVLIIYADGTDLGGVIADKGTYFARTTNKTYTSRLTIPGYTGFYKGMIYPDLINMPETLKTDESLSFKDGRLSVNTATETEEDNTLPITSAAVARTVGNIEVILQTI